MAGQPQEPSWTPSGQEQTQARPAWPPQPTFSPPPGAPQDVYGYPQQAAQGGYAPPPPPPASVGQPRSGTGRGFFASLFDFSFTSMVTPKIIKVLYVLFTLWTALVALVVLVIGFRSGGMSGGLVVLIVVEPILILLMLGLYRVILEAFMVIFRIYEETVKIREYHDRANSDSRILRSEASTAGLELSTARSPCMHGLTRDGCPQRVAAKRAVFHRPGAVTHRLRTW